MFSDGDVYQQIGEDGFARLVAAFYAQVPGDDILGPMYPQEDMAGAEERLRDFLVGRFEIGRAHRLNSSHTDISRMPSSA